MYNEIRLSRSSAALLLCLAGCGKILGLPDDPVYEGQGGMQGVDEEGDSRWACVDEESNEPPKSSGQDVSVRLRACNFIKHDCTEPLEGLSARLCAKIDANCSDPLISDIPIRNGVFTFDVPTGGDGFDGYLMITSATALCTNDEVFGAAAPALCSMLPDCNTDEPDDACAFPLFPTSLRFFNPPITTNLDSELSVSLIPSAAVPQLVQAGGAGEVDPSRGFLFMTAYDCMGKTTADVTFEANRVADRTVPLYISSGVISPTATATDDSGIGGLSALPTGFVQVVAKRANSDDPVAEVGVQIAAFAITYVDLVP